MSNIQYLPASDVPPKIGSSQLGLLTITERRDETISLNCQDSVWPPYYSICHVLFRFPKNPCLIHHYFPQRLKAPWRAPSYSLPHPWRPCTFSHSDKKQSWCKRAICIPIKTLQAWGGLFNERKGVGGGGKLAQKFEASFNLCPRSCLNTEEISPCTRKANSEEGCREQ